MKDSQDPEVVNQKTGFLALVLPQRPDLGLDILAALHRHLDGFDVSDLHLRLQLLRHIGTLEIVGAPFESITRSAELVPVDTAGSGANEGARGRVPVELRRDVAAALVCKSPIASKLHGGRSTKACRGRQSGMVMLVRVRVTGLRLRPLIVQQRM